MDTIDFLIGARINNSTAPMQRCRAQNSNHKHGASNAFVKEWPTQPSPSTRILQPNPLHPNLNRFRFGDDDHPSQCTRDASTPTYELHEGIKKKLPELVITTSSPTKEEGRGTMGMRSSGAGGKRAESPAKKYLRSWTE
ncbi:hypothetical protein KC318_g12462 [Hortaea werneckii]|nr:hypothetical protein KC334_g13262 [Hortaea werneckii]KAI6962405.1 hypothetical protein KC355_g12511 [Hortaea werneckii]KAI7153389.1 hypothetical protein KC324_g14632 [Hortaea werneckii]KAI7546697.1 hypothetical protein KC316_g14738 [Hortaea werneckii]KAI7656343.1 hypothetical protein KC318_g12462 [Hortaea werneckii]